MKKITMCWLVAILFLLPLCMGAAPQPVKMTITIGGTTDRSLIDLPGIEFNKRLSIPIAISLDKVMPGCNGGVVPMKYRLVLSANCHGKYNPANGETFLRLEQETYSITLQDNVEPHVENIKGESK